LPFIELGIRNKPHISQRSGGLYHTLMEIQLIDFNEIHCENLKQT